MLCEVDIFYLSCRAAGYVTQLGNISLSQSNSALEAILQTTDYTNLEGVCWFWWKEGELGSDPWWAGRATEKAANLTKTQTHPVHNVVTTGLEILIIWIFGQNTGNLISALHVPALYVSRLWRLSDLCCLSLQRHDTPLCSLALLSFL